MSDKKNKKREDLEINKELEEESEYGLEDETEEEYELEDETEEEYELEDYQEEVEDNSIPGQIFKINIRIQEIDAILENYEEALYSKNEEILSEEEYDNLKEEYRDLVKQRKELTKQRKESIWDYMPTWMAVYAIFQIVFCFFIILTQASAYFAEWMYGVFTKVPDWLFYTLPFVIPFLNLMLSLTIYFFIKDKKQRKLFFYIYLIQIIQTLITVVILIFVLVKR